MKITVKKGDIEVSYEQQLSVSDTAQIFSTYTYNRAINIIQHMSNQVIRIASGKLDEGLVPEKTSKCE